MDRAEGPVYRNFTLKTTGLSCKKMLPGPDPHGPADQMGLIIAADQGGQVHLYLLYVLLTLLGLLIWMVI